MVLRGPTCNAIDVRHNHTHKAFPHRLTFTAQYNASSTTLQPRNTNFYVRDEIGTAARTGLKQVQIQASKPTSRKPQFSSSPLERKPAERGSHLNLDQPLRELPLSSTPRPCPCSCPWVLFCRESFMCAVSTCLDRTVLRIYFRTTVLYFVSAVVLQALKPPALPSRYVFHLHDPIMYSLLLCWNIPATARTGGASASLHSWLSLVCTGSPASSEAIPRWQLGSNYSSDGF